MTQLNMNITEHDRNISRLLSSNNQPNPNQIKSQTEDITVYIEKLKDLIAIINEIGDSFKTSGSKLKDFIKDMEALSNTEKGTTKNDSEKKGNIFEEGWKKQKSFFSTPEGAASKTKEYLKDVQEIFKNDKSAQVILSWAGNIASATENFINGDYIKAALDIGKTVASIITIRHQSRKEIKKFYQELEQATINYSIKMIAATKNIKSGKDSIFDTDTANKLAKGMAGYNDAQVKLKQLEGRLSTEEIQTGKKKKKTFGIRTGTKTQWGSVADNYKKILQTDKDLIDAEGNLNMTIANSLLESGKLSSEATTTIKNMVAVQTAADEAMKQVNETLSSTAGSLGSDLQTALVKAFQTGTDAATDFSQSVSKILENIVIDQMFNSIFGEMLKNLENEMKDSFSAYGDQDITDDISRFYNGYGDKIGLFNQNLENAQKKIKNLSGLDILPNQSHTQDTTKGYSVSMDQDTGGAILGRITGLNETGIRLESGLNTIMEAQIERNNIFTQQSNQLLQLCSVNLQSMYYLEDIKNNTKQLYQINDRLGTIEQHTSRL